MSDYNRSIGRSSLRLRRPKRSDDKEAGPEQRSAREARFNIGPPQRKAHREVIAAQPALSLDVLSARLPNPIITHLSVDDVCKETLFIVDLLGNDGIDIS